MHGSINGLITQYFNYEKSFQQRYFGFDIQLYNSLQETQDMINGLIAHGFDYYKSFQQRYFGFDN